VGTLLAAIALAIDVKDRTNSGLWVGAVLVAAWLPTLVVGLALGPLIDRLERRKLMVAADLVRAAVFCALPFTGRPESIVGLALVAGLASGFFRPAVFAGVPNLVPEEELSAATGLLTTLENVSWAIGPVLGGLLTAAAGPHAAYWINAVSFVVSAALIARIPARLLQSETALSRGHWRDLREGFTTVMRSRPLLAVLFSWGIAAFGLGALSVSEIFLAKNTFDAGDFGYGLLYGAIGLGLVLGSFWSSPTLELLGTARTYSAALGLMALGFAAAAVSPNVWIAAICCVVGGIGNGGAVACNYLLVQQGTTDDVRGRALTVVMSATLAAMGIAYGIGGAVVHLVGARWIWGAAAVAYGIGSVFAYALAREPVEQPMPKTTIDLLASSYLQRQ
jgi:MFS family permease